MNKGTNAIDPNKKSEICELISNHLPQGEILTFLEKISPGLISKERKKYLQDTMIQPLTINKSDSLGPFLNCQHNQEENNFRSPWSNIYYPNNPTHKGFIAELRALEVKFNNLIKIYTKLYYGDNAVSSVYMWDQNQSIQTGFNCVVLIKHKKDNNFTSDKTIEKNGIICNGSIDAIHNINIKFGKELIKDKEEKKVVVHLDSTMIYECKFEGMDMSFSGKVFKDKEESRNTKNYMNQNELCDGIGEMIEKMENSLLLQIDESYLQKQHNIVFKMRNHAIAKTSNKEQSINIKNLFTEIEKKEKEKKLKQKSETTGIKR